MKTSLKNTLRIYLRDLKGIFKNPISMLIIGGLCLVPSLYSFLNVIGCWNAYSNTSKIRIAVVNNDAGTTLAGKKLNIGDNIVAQLKTNNAIDWTFVNSKKGNIGLESGLYYSELIIPKDFSSNLRTITSNNPVKPELVYRVNTKLGPVANKITEVAQQNLVAQIRGSIIAAISQQMFTTLNTYGNKAQADKNEILALKSAIINLNNNMGNVQNSLNNAYNSANNLNGYLDTIKSTFPQINESLSTVKTSTVNLGNIVSSTKNILNTSVNNVGSNLNTSKDDLDSINNLLNNLNNKQNLNDVTNSLNTITTQLNVIESNVNSTLNFLESIVQKNSNQKIQSLINELKNTKTALDNEKALISNATTNSSNLSKTLISNTASKIKQSNAETTNYITNSVNLFNGSVKEQLNSISTNLINAANTATTLINDSQNLNGKIENVLNSASNGSSLAASTSKQLNYYLSQYSGIIKELGTKLESVSDQNVDAIIGLLRGNPLVMSEHLSAPFNFKQETIFPVANYGSGMTPVYSVLAFWVGCLLLSSILRTEPVEFEGLEYMTIRERHFGKMLIFVTLAVIQSVIITIGAKYLLHVQVVNMPLFVLSSMLTAATFGIIIFTIVAMFRTIGKAMCIILMVVQLSGTGGTYPVQAMPLFFRMVEPFLPFPYGVDVMREAIGGPYWPNVVKDITSLIAFALIFILIGYFFKKPSFGFFNMFENKFSEAGIAEED